MAEKKNEVAEQPKQQLSFSESLTNSLMEVKEALPTDLNITRFVQNGVALLNGNETLAKFAKQNGTGQIRSGMVQAAYLGLDFMSSEAYLIPYGSTLDFRRSYIGDIKLAKKYSVRPVLEIRADVVRDGDEFESGIENGKPYVNFKPKPFNTGKVIGAFAICLYKDGGMTYDTMNIDELNAAKSKSKMQNAMAWKDFPWQMQKKTVIHRLCHNQMQLEFENPKQRELFEEDMEIETDQQKIVENDVAENQCTEEFIDAEVVDAEPEFMK